MYAIDVLAIMVTVFCSGIICYQYVFALCSLLLKSPTVTGHQSNYFAILIPAHNEEQVIEGLLESLQGIEYKGKYEVHVVADNCTDSTENLVKESGFSVLVRCDDKKRGKGYAVDWAIRELRDRGSWEKFDAVVMIDADGQVNPGFLQAFDRKLCSGAKVIQGKNGTLNPHHAMTLLMAISDTLQFDLYFLGRNKLQLSVPLLGNGMCFRREILDIFEWQAYSIVEDGEYYLNLVQAGYKVEYEPEAVCNSQQITSLNQGYSQRMRWGSGYYEMCWQKIPKLLTTAMRTCTFWRAEAVVNFVWPSLSVQGFIFAASTVLVVFSTSIFTRYFFAIIVLSGFLYVCWGICKTKGGWRVLWYLPFIPVFVVWKIGLKIAAFFNREKSWKRTRRNLNPSTSTENCKDNRDGDTTSR